MKDFRYNGNIEDEQRLAQALKDAPNKVFNGYTVAELMQEIDTPTNTRRRNVWGTIYTKACQMMRDGCSRLEILEETGLDPEGIEDLRSFREYLNSGTYQGDPVPQVTMTVVDGKSMDHGVQKMHLG